MAIITHPDGYLQITEGHNWQDISDNSILQRIFRGWNERRLVSGLPLYWYGQNPNASILLGGDAQFTEFENPLTVPNPTYTIDDARIYPGANLQNVAFWRKLQELEIDFGSSGEISNGRAFFPLFKDIYNYSDVVFYIDAIFAVFIDFLGVYEYAAKVGDLSFLRDTARIYANPSTRSDLFQRYTSQQNTTTGYIEQGDIIGLHILNDILKVFYEFQNAIVPVTYSGMNRFGNSIGEDYEIPTNCQEAINNASNEWSNNPTILSPQLTSGYLLKIGSGESRTDTVFGYFSYMQGLYINDEKWKIKYFEKVNSATWVLNSVTSLGDVSQYFNPLPSYPEGQVKTLNFIPQSDEVVHNPQTTNNQPLTAAPDIFAGGWTQCDRYFDYEIYISLLANYQFADLAPYVPNAYNYNINISNIDQPQPQSNPIIG